MPINNGAASRCRANAFSSGYMEPGARSADELGRHAVRFRPSAPIFHFAADAARHLFAKPSWHDKLHFSDVAMITPILP